MPNEIGLHGDAPNSEWLEQFVENQKQELSIRAQELELAKQQNNHNIEYAKEALAAQERDRKDERNCARVRSRDRHRLVVLLTLIIAALIGVAIYKGNSDIAKELVKAIAFLTAGAFGGYGYASKKLKETDSNTDSQS